LKQNYRRLLLRKKRAVLFPSGAKVCPEETVEQAMINHLQYFKLRACQEIIWEAFKIFWDRLPDYEDYRIWTNLCEGGSTNLFEIGTNFSHSEEHFRMITKKLSLMKEAVSRSEKTAPSPAGVATPFKETTVNVLPPQEMSVKSTMQNNISTHEETENNINNEIKKITEKPLKPIAEQMVEFSIHLSEEMYGEGLSDQSTTQYQQLTARFISQVQSIFQELPGYKKIRVIEFRPPQEKGRGGVEVHYTVTFDGDAETISNATLDLINLHSNKVEVNNIVEGEDHPTAIYTINDFRGYITDALFKKTSAGNITMALDPHSLRLITGPGFPLQEASSLTDFDFSAKDDTFILNENLLPYMKPGSVALFDDGSGSGFDHSGQEMEANLRPRTISTLEPVSYPTPSSWLEDNILVQTLIEENTNRMTIDYTVDPVNFSANTPQEKLLDTTGEEFKIKTEAFDRFIITKRTPNIPLFIETTSEQAPKHWTQESLNVELSSQTAISEHIDNDSLILRPTMQSLFLNTSKEELSTSMDDIGLLLNKTRESVWEQQHGSSSAMYQTVNGISNTEDFSHSVKQTDHTNIHLSMDKTHLRVDTSEKPLLEIFTSSHEKLDSQFRVQEVTSSPVIRPHSSEPTESTINLLEKVTDQDKLLSPITSITRKSTLKLLTTAQQASIYPEATTKIPNLAQLTTGSEDILQQSSTIYNAFSVNDVNSTMKSVTATVGNAKQDKTSSDSNIVDRHDQFSKVPFLHPTELIPPVISVTEDEEIIMRVQDIAIELDHKGTVYYGPGMNQEEKKLTGDSAHSTDMAGEIVSTEENDTNVTGRALVVFFSLRVTNMIFSEDLFNKNSPEYKALEQHFLELLVPYLQSNLTGFQNLEILNFRNGSIVINSRMKFERPVPRNVTNAVYIILEDFCNTAYRTMNLAIDKHSLDVEAGEQADPCKYQACNEFSECLVNHWSGEGECVCNPGHMSIDGLPCQSVCDLQPDFCLNDGKCDIIPGKGAICRCHVGENWWYRGEHCEEYVSEPMVVGLAIASVAGFLLVVSAVLFFLAKTFQHQDVKRDREQSASQRSNSLSFIENAEKYNRVYESEIAGYSQHCRRYPQLSSYSSTSADASTDFSSKEIRDIHETKELTQQEIQDRVQIIELYAKDQQFAEFGRHQMSLNSARKGTLTRCT
uniref:Interphotoreceptor matrix proteoglycan 2 n=1 Tax=Geotrypetes seraphini TaxID=260995 RepID=A0A6P8RBM4_GEOSA